MTHHAAPATVAHMTAGQPQQGATVTRPRHHIEAVRQDAIAAAEHYATQAGTTPSRLITDAISWALGEHPQAPFTGTPTPTGPTPEQLADEITACRTHLRTTPATPGDASVSRAWGVLPILEWLTGADDLPPTYQRDTQPGDLVGGHGRIVRAYITTRSMILAARDKISTGQTSHGYGADWHQGVIATIEWVEGERTTPPMAHPGGTACTHPDSDGRPDDRQITRERGAAEEHLQALGYRHGDIPPAYADAVACTIRWLHGGTTTPPVTEDD
jgi:hypothetical protein